MMVTADWATLQYYYSLPLHMLLRFGQWDEILAFPEPAADLPYARAIWHYARGMAKVRRGDLPGAEAELTHLANYADDPAMEELKIWGFNTFRQVFQLAREVLAGELAAARGDWGEAIARLEEAVFLEDALLYQEPPDWPIPARHNLGAVLLAAGRPADAEEVYRQDLEIYPGNGWSLYGLARALEGQGEDASAAEAAFSQAWRNADIEIDASRL
jgi:tetratricopeptide (TPR) repeat protein